MDYLERAAKISAEANLSEKEVDLFISLTNPLLGKEYDFVELYNLFEKLIKYDQGVKLVNYIQRSKSIMKQNLLHIRN